MAEGSVENQLSPSFRQVEFRGDHLTSHVRTCKFFSKLLYFGKSAIINSSDHREPHPCVFFFFSNTAHLTSTKAHCRKSCLFVPPRRIAMPSLAAILIYILGLSCFVTGWFTLWDPMSAAAQLGFPSVCIPVSRGNSLAAIAMGVYYTLAGYQGNKIFFWLSVPMRLLTTTVFWNQGWNTPAIWEGSCAFLTLGALLLE
jgi:hypothetical protein